MFEIEFDASFERFSRKLNSLRLIHWVKGSNDLSGTALCSYDDLQLFLEAPIEIQPNLTDSEIETSSANRITNNNLIKSSQQFEQFVIKWTVLRLEMQIFD